MLYEDFTTYTVQDVNNRFIITTNKIDVNNMPRNEDAWVYKDAGVAHFGSDFEHDVKH